MNLTQTPPGGWQYHVPQTGWWAPNPVAHTFDQQKRNIQKHLLGNPAIVAKHKIPTDLETIGKQLIKFQQIRGALPGDPIPKLTPPQSAATMSGGVRAAVAAVKKMASGAALLFEWQEAGMPHVDQHVAESRASICVKCPKNEQGKSLTDIFTVPVAAQLKKKMELLSDMNLSTSHDKELAVCSACACPLRTKVWVPGELILKRLKPEVKADLHESCWILKLQSLTSSSPKAPLPPNTSPASSAVGS